MSQTPSAIPDTAAYYYAAYAVLGVLYAGYVWSLWWRARKLKGVRE